MDKPVKRRKEPAESGGIAPVVSAAWRAALASFCSVAVLLLIFSAVAYAQPDPDTLVLPFAYAALGIMSFLSGIFSSVFAKSNVLAVSAATSVIIVAVMIAVSLASSGGLPFHIALLIYCGIFVMGALGAASGIKYSGRRHKKHRKHN